MTTESKDFECVVSADLFRRALVGVSTEPTRYYLNGVHVSPAPQGGAVLVATNGSFLIAVHDPEAYIDGEGIVLIDRQMKAALKVSGIMLERRLLVVRQAANAHRAFVVDMPSKSQDETYAPYLAARELLDAPDARVRAAQFGAVTIDGKFPDWRRVIPKTLNRTAPIPVVDQLLLSRAADALSMDTKLRRVRLTCNGDDPANGPILVMSDEPRAISAFAIVMPVRASDRAVEVPAWTLPKAAAAA